MAVPRSRATPSALPRIVAGVLVALTCALAAPPGFGQAGADPATPNEWSADARRAYAQGLKDARELIGRKKYDDAVALLDKLSAERPREPQARFLKGVAQSDAGKTDDAIATYRGVIAEYPELPEPHNNLAVLYAAKGEYALARGELETAIGVAPDYLVAYENLGDVYARLAVQNYERAIARDPRNRTAPVKMKGVSDALTARPKPPPAAADAAAGVPPAPTTEAAK
jgi:tetratricopeptide (TPR) repeat protein